MSKITVKGMVPAKKNTIKVKYSDGGGNVLGDGKRSKETEVTREVTPAKKGNLYLEEGTVQRRKTGSGVDFVPSSEEGSISKGGKIVDRKSGRSENEGKAMMRKATVDAHKNTDLSGRYKQGDYVTYQTSKGPEVAGRIGKEKDTPPTYETKKTVVAKAEKAPTMKRSSVSDIAKRAAKEKTSMSSSAKAYKAEGSGMYGTTTARKSKEVDMSDRESLKKSDKEGYVVEDPTLRKEQMGASSKKEHGSKGIMVLKKYMKK